MIEQGGNVPPTMVFLGVETMAHEIESMDRPGYAFKPAWHGLGRTFDRLMTTAEVLEETSVGDYNVVQVPGWLPYDAETGRIWIPPTEQAAPPVRMSWVRTDAHFNLRDDVKLPNRTAILSPLGVGPGYEVVQNYELCEIADRIISDTGAQYEAAGTLRNGRLVWLLARFPGDYAVSGDALRRYILIYAAHDGSKAIVVAATTVRVVCWNTLSAALADGGDNKVEIRHTANARERIAQAVSAVQLTKESFEAQHTLYQSMTQRSVSKRFVDAYLKALYPNPVEGKGTFAIRKRETIMGLIYGKQAGGERAAMTVDGDASEWAVYNGVSEYWQHQSRSQVREGFDRNEERFRQNMMGGTQETKRSEALETLLNRESLELSAVSSN